MLERLKCQRRGSTLDCLEPSLVLSLSFVMAVNISTVQFESVRINSNLTLMFSLRGYKHIQWCCDQVQRATWSKVANKHMFIIRALLSNYWWCWLCKSNFLFRVPKRRWRFYVFKVFPFWRFCKELSAELKRCLEFWYTWAVSILDCHIIAMFKGSETLPTLHLHRQSAYLMGRDRKVKKRPLLII